MCAASVRVFLAGQARPVTAVHRMIRVFRQRGERCVQARGSVSAGCASVLRMQQGGTLAPSVRNVR